MKPAFAARRRLSSRLVLERSLARYFIASSSSWAGVEEVEEEEEDEVECMFSRPRIVIGRDDDRCIINSVLLQS